MKKFILFLVVLFTILFSINAYAVDPSGIQVRGAAIDNYVLSDPDNVSGLNVDGYKMFMIPGEHYIMVERPDRSTYKESLGCWEDPALPCPTAETAPTLWFLETVIMWNLPITGELTQAEEELYYVSFWYEYKIKDSIEDALLNMSGLNNQQKRVALKYMYFAHGVDLVTADALAFVRIPLQGDGAIPKYTDLNILVLPEAERDIVVILEVPIYCILQGCWN